MMKTAFAYWGNRIAPVFDNAQQIHIIEAESGGAVSETQETLSEDLLLQKTLRLVELSISTLVCGAISKPLYEMLTAYGIRVIPFVTGDLREIIHAQLTGRLSRKAFTMPGCCGRRRFRKRYANYTEANTMNGEERGKDANKSSKERRRDQGRRRTGGGPSEAGHGGTCICPKCGHREPHERNEPCFMRICPKCGTIMTRR